MDADVGVHRRLTTPSYCGGKGWGGVGLWGLRALPPSIPGHPVSVDAYEWSTSVGLHGAPSYRTPSLPTVWVTVAQSASLQSHPESGARGWKR